MKVSVVLPEGTVEAVRARVGVREFSAFVAEAVDEMLRQQNLREFIAEHEKEHGEIPDEVIAPIKQRWQDAIRRNRMGDH